MVALAVIEMLGGIFSILALPVIYSVFAVDIKRLHDMDRSGWYSLINLIPVVGTLIILIWLGFFKGTEGENRFGPDVD
jgi:uncharacterized membrane protein YhaH (DUF805 family)